MAVRIAPIALAELDAGGRAESEAAAIGSWIALVKSGEFEDSQSDAIRLALANENQIKALLALLDPEISKATAFVELVSQETEKFIHS